MRIIASVVTRNESPRYLRSCLEWNSQWWDELFVWDDRSSDDTAEICADYTEYVIVRPEGVTSFMESEWKFRQTGWSLMENMLDVRDGDFIMSFDADEFLVSKIPDSDIYSALRNLAVDVTKSYRWSANIKIPQIWSQDDWICRADGYWDDLFLPKLIQHRTPWGFRKKDMGCGSGPLYTYDNPLEFSQTDLALLHLGHAVDEDRQEKYQRYMSVENHGHNPKHIRSIPSKAQRSYLWNGMKPVVYRGDGKKVPGVL